jgi:hypothetical protein
MKKFIFLLILVPFIISCGHQVFMKRKYTRGLFRETFNAGGTTRKATVRENGGKLRGETPAPIPAETGPGQKYIVPVLTFNQVAEGIGSPAKNKRGTDCDTMVLRDGKKTAGRILVVTDREIRYTGCNPQDSALSYLPLDQVVKIKYRNGVQENFSDHQGPVENLAEPKHLTGETYATVGYGLGITGSLLLMLVFPALGAVLAFLALLCVILLKARRSNRHKIWLKTLIVMGSIASSLAILCFGLLILLVIALKG